MSASASQKAAFLGGAGISMSELNVFISAIYISLVFIFVMVILIGSVKSWGKSDIDAGELFARVLGLVLLVIISVYLVN